MHSFPSPSCPTILYFSTDWKISIKQYKHICQNCSQWLVFSEETIEKEQCLIPSSVGFTALCYLSFCCLHASFSAFSF